MSPLGCDHALEGCGEGLGVVEGRHRKPTHGRQGKRPARGPAHVVGKIEEFVDITSTRCWRLVQIAERFQCPERHRPELPEDVAS